MPLVINTNVASLNSQRQLVKSGSDMSQAMERLSSGKRVNTAADDAAGLAIANRMTSQIRGLNQAVRNAYDGISLMQTAEGALDETTNILQRIRELAIQSANGIYADSDRSTLDAEVQQLVLELDRITQTTTFNGQKLLDGNLNGVDLQIGSNAYETVTLEIPSLSAKSLGMGSQSVDMLGAEVADLSTIVLSETDVLINGQSIGKFDGTATPPDTFQDLIDNINDNVLGVSASGYTSLEATNVGDGVLEGVIFQINVEAGDGTGTNTYNISDTKSMDELIEKIGNVTGGNINASQDEQGKLVLTNNTGSTITVTTTATTQADIQLVEDATGFDIESNADNTPDPVSARGQIILTSEYDDPITISRGATGTLADLANLGFRENTQAGTIEGVAISSPSVAWGVGDISINGTVVPNDDTDSLQGKINAINAVTSDTGVIASSFVSATLDFDGVDVTALATTFELNGVVVDLTSVTSTEEIVDAFNALADETGVGASLLGTRVVLEGHASSITFRDGAGAVATGLGDGTNVAQLLSSEDGSAAGNVATGDQVEGGLRLQSENNTPIAITLGNNADVATHGFLEANSTGEGRFGAGLNTISVSTAAQSQRALEVVDRALEEINAVRSGMGAVTNRLEFTISNLMNVSENTTAARSRIIDADFAEETANLSRAQVLQSASQAMLAQANARPQQVLQLLQ